jgi:hypothetical protein
MFFRSRAERAQDLALFLESEALFCEEALLGLLAGMKAERAFRRNTRTRMLQFIDFFAKEEHRYHSGRLQTALEDLLAVLIVLRHFTAAHFFLFPKEQQDADHRYFLHPDYFEFGICEGTMTDHEFYLNLDLLLKKHLLRLEKAQKSYYALSRRKVRPPTVSNADSH